MCNFWLVDNLAHQGLLDEALELYGYVSTPRAQRP